MQLLVLIGMLLPRQLVLRALCALPAFQPLASRAIDDAPAPLLPPPAVVPLELCGGAYCVNYTIDRQLFRAVVDTGSPFVLVDGTCTEELDGPRAKTLWGCYRGTGRPSGLAPTDELFGGMDVGTEWKRGELALGAAVRPTREGWVTDGPSLVATVPDATFGIVRSTVDKGTRLPCRTRPLNPTTEPGHSPKPPPKALSSPPQAAVRSFSAWRSGGCLASGRASSSRRMSPRCALTSSAKR